MLLGKDTDWTNFYLSISVPETVISHYLATLQIIQKEFREPSPEQEIFALNYSQYYTDREPGSIESLRIVNNQYFKRWLDYFKRKTNFSIIKYKLIALDFYRKNPVLDQTKELLTAIYLQIPSNDPLAYKRLLGLKRTDNRIYLKQHLKLLRNRSRFFYNNLDYKREADMYLSLTNAIDSI
jgi:hypothetical protein